MSLPSSEEHLGANVEAVHSIRQGAIKSQLLLVVQSLYRPSWLTEQLQVCFHCADFEEGFWQPQQLHPPQQLKNREILYQFVECYKKKLKSDLKMDSVKSKYL